MKHFIITIFFLKLLLVAFAQNDVIVEATDAQVDAGNEIIYPITINPNGNIVATFNIEIEYDNNLFEILDIENANGWLVSSNDNTPGIIGAIGFNIDGQNTLFQPFNLIFNAIGQAGQTSQVLLNIEYVTDKNGNNLSYLNSNGSISINGCDPAMIGTACDDGDACTEGETYYNNCNCKGGIFQDADDDGVCKAVDPDDNDPCSPNSCENCELLPNTKFDIDLSSWDYWGCDAASINGVASLTAIDVGRESWESALYTRSILIDQGKTYEIKFTAWADANRTIDVKIGQNETPFLNYQFDRFNLTTDKQDFSTSFSMEYPTDINTAFNFFMGGNTTNVYIDNVSLVKTNCGCYQQGENCDDGNECTTGETFDTDCNCAGGIEVPECDPPCRYTDSLTLVAVYNGLNGSDWQASRQWDFTQPMDTWRGISLNADGCVDRISLTEYNITGILAPEIGDLREITTINLHENRIGGNIPSSIGNLNSLKSLNLDDNNFDGSIPSSIGNLTNLTYLHLGRNNLTGSIPSSIGNLINLENLNLYKNNITSIPTSIGDLEKIENIFLSQNTITNLPSSVGNLTELVLLDLRNNNINSIPPEISNLLNLVNLYLSNNRLTSIPSTIGELNKLDKLWLSDNQLSNLPSSIGNLDKLTNLNIFNNKIIGNMPAWLINLSSLNNLQMFNNKFIGCYDNDLNILCERLSFTYNSSISDDNNFDAPWEDFCNDLAGACFTPSCRYTDSLALVALHNGFNERSGWDFTQPMETWRGITLNANGCVAKITMDEFGLSGILAPEIGDLREITSIDLEENGLSGSIPSSIGKLINLKLLNLGDNNIIGNIPTSIGNLNSLSTLALGRNELNGNIPLSFSNLVELTSLSLGNNQLTGTLPEGIGSLTNLITLFLSDNELNGNIPSSFSNLNQLTYLYLGNNQFTGSMPAWFSNLKNLEQLQMRNNKFIGCYDNDLYTLCNQLSFASNNSISDGNNFDAPWEDFCSDLDGTCKPVSCRYTDSLALVAIYNGLNAGNQWDFTQPIDTWKGITLNVNGCVDKIKMDEFGSNGILVSEIGNLSEITSIDFEENSINGNIPYSIGNLTSLKSLNLGNNNFNENIPTSIGDLVNLSVLDLGRNKLNGSIPLSFNKLTELTSLTLSANQLTGSIPAGIGTLTNLKSLNLRDNSLNGNIPSSFSNLKELTSLYLSNNQFTGSLPEWLSDLSKLTSLIISNNQLSGCYNNDLIILCDQLSFGSNNSNISDGNNFHISWEDFCSTLAGACPSDYCGNDANTLLLLPFDNTLNGVDGEIPSASSAIGFATGKYSSALNINGGTTNPSLSYPVENNLNPQKGSIEAWVMHSWNEENISEQHTLVHYGWLGGLLFLNDNNYFRLILNRWSPPGYPEFDVGVSTQNWKPGEWKHVAATWGNGEISLYIDGKVAGRNTYTQPIASIDDTHFNIGSEAGGQANWSGLIDNLRISNTIRSQNEIVDFMIVCIEDKLAHNSTIEIHNFPNPFTSETTISYMLPNEKPVTIFVTGIMGKKVATLLNNKEQAKGRNHINFNGSHLPPGIYYYTIKAGDYLETQRMILMK